VKNQALQRGKTNQILDEKKALRSENFLPQLQTQLNQSFNATGGSNKGGQNTNGYVSDFYKNKSKTKLQPEMFIKSEKRSLQNSGGPNSV